MRRRQVVVNAATHGAVTLAAARQLISPLKTLFEESQSLPEGLWLVKWVDYFSLGRGFISSPRVHVVLQKIQHRDMATPERLSQQDVGYLVGRRPGQSPDGVASWAIRPVLTGTLPLLRIGDVVRGHRIEGALRQREATISLTGDTPVRTVGILDEQPPPQEWNGKHYRVLNRFEHELGAQPEVRDAKCLSIKIGRAEYLIPATVILTTFYGFHTEPANAAGPRAFLAACPVRGASRSAGIADREKPC